MPAFSKSTMSSTLVPTVFIANMVPPMGLSLIHISPAGSTYPYGMDPEDSNIRIAPTYPTLEELEPATKILCLCIKIATIEKMIAQASEQETAPQNAYAIAQ